MPGSRRRDKGRHGLQIEPVEDIYTYVSPVGSRIAVEEILDEEAVMLRDRQLSYLGNAGQYYYRINGLPAVTIILSR